MTRRIVPLLALLLASACGDSRPETPPPSVAATPPPGQLRPLTAHGESDAQPPSSPELPPGHPSTDTLPPGHPPLEGKSGTTAPAASEGEAVTGTVTLAPGLKDHKGRALFVIARSAASGQIVAVRKEGDVHFPYAFRISGADAMTQGTSFVGPFDLTVRLSRTGDAMSAPGDVEGAAKGVKAGARDVAIVLDTVRQ